MPKTKEIKREGAIKRQELYDSLTKEQKIKKLGSHKASKQRKRLRRIK